MPIFDFVCSSCNQEFEELCVQSVQSVACPSCGSPRTERQLSVFAAHTAGSQTACGLPPEAKQSCGFSQGGSCACDM